jgi:hypothetical protein
MARPLIFLVIVMLIQFLDSRRKALERATRIELAFSAWEAEREQSEPKL